jgi:hypothetical protein
MTEKETTEDIIKDNSEEQEIGNSDLISSLLTQRISETPTARVPEVEVPDPTEELTTELTETLVIEKEKPEVIEPDPKEYDEKPTIRRIESRRFGAQSPTPSDDGKVGRALVRQNAGFNFGFHL